MSITTEQANEVLVRAGEEAERQLVRVQLLRDTAQRLFVSMVARATAGAQDGDLVRTYDKAIMAVRARGVDGEAVLGAALGLLLVQLAQETQEALMNEAARMENGGS